MSKKRGLKGHGFSKNQRNKPYYAKRKVADFTIKKNIYRYDTLDSPLYKSIAIKDRYARRRILNELRMLSQKRVLNNREKRLQDRFWKYEREVRLHEGIVCARRRIKRIMLFLTGKAGKGVPSNPFRIRTADSNIDCRRK